MAIDRGNKHSIAEICEPNGATRKRAHSLEIEARKAKIGELLVRGMSITAIAAEVKVNKSTVSRYVTDLQESTSRYLYDLCKNNLPAFYQQCVVDIDKARVAAWKIYEENKSKPSVQLNAVKNIVACNQAKFSLLNEGPITLQFKEMQERLEKIEDRQRQQY